MVKNSKNKKSIPKDLFQKQLEKIKESLPLNYGVLIKHFYPKVEIRSVYNVVNYGVHDEDILKMLAFLVTSKN